MSNTPKSTILGYPRIGPNRELKKAVEGYWAGKITAEALAEAGATIRAQTWTGLSEAGLDEAPSNTFSYYDQVLDTAIAVGAIPDRFRELGLSELDTYFALARGTDELAPLELTKWFDTNYHYLVPELTPETAFAANPSAGSEKRIPRDTFTTEGAVRPPPASAANSPPCAPSPGINSGASITRCITSSEALVSPTTRPTSVARPSARRTMSCTCSKTNRPSDAIRCCWNSEAPGFDVTVSRYTARPARSRNGSIVSKPRNGLSVTASAPQ